MAFSNLTKHLILALLSCNIYIYVSFLAINSQESEKQMAAEEEEKTPALVLLLPPLLLNLLPLWLPFCFGLLCICALILRLLLQSSPPCLIACDREG
jgi:hypothetical protein